MRKQLREQVEEDKKGEQVEEDKKGEFIFKMGRKHSKSKSK